MIAGASQDLTNDLWWPLADTVTAMFGLIHSLSIVGDALRDALDPKIGRSPRATDARAAPDAQHASGLH